MSRAKPLTLRLLRGLSHVTAYATAGTPENIGLADDAEGERQLRETLDAHEWVMDRLSRAKAKAARKRIVQP